MFRDGVDLDTGVSLPFCGARRKIEEYTENKAFYARSKFNDFLSHCSDEEKWLMFLMMYYGNDNRKPRNDSKGVAKIMGQGNP